MSGTHDLLPEILAQYGASRNSFDQVISMAGDANYVYLTPNYDDTVEVDFTLNPFIAAEIEKPNPILNPSSVQRFDKPSMYSIGFDRDGVQVYSQRTAQTFQPSQGFYQDLVTLEQTGFKFDVFEFLIPPEATTVFHSHTNGVELFYVLGGEPANDDNPDIADNDDVIFELNADVDGVFNTADPQNPFSILKDDEIELNGVTVTKGSFVAVPAGKIHTWANTGLIPATVIALIVPGGIAEGFGTVGASAGIYDPPPGVHPILAQNGTSNLIPTGVTPTEVNGIVPEDRNFYDFFQQVAINPGVLEQLSFTDFPTYLQDAGPVAVYGVNADGSGAFKLDPSDEAGIGGIANPNGGSALQGDDSPGIESITAAPVDPFSGSTFANPFTVLRFGQNDGILNPTPIEVKLFSISSEEGEYSVTSDNHEFFGVLEGELVFEFGENGNDLRHLQVAKAGDYVYIEPGNHFHLWASDQLNSSRANLIQFSALAEPVDSLLDTPMYRFQNTLVPGSYLYVGEAEKQDILTNFSHFKEEGFAFNVATQGGDNLIKMYRLQNTVFPGTYIYVGEEERQSILANSTAYIDEGLAFYAYGAGSNKGNDIYRFQNIQTPSAYLYVGEEERQSVLANFSHTFVEEGLAFEASLT